MSPSKVLSSSLMSPSTRLHSLHDVGAVGPFVHGILLDQPVRVAVDARVRVVLMVGRGLSSFCVTLCAE